jgi:hypothetical protein
MFACYTRAVCLLTQSTISDIAKTEWHSAFRFARISKVRGFYHKVFRMCLVSPYKSKIVPVQVMQACGGAEVCSHSFLTSPVCGAEWLASRSGHFTPGESWHPLTRSEGRHRKQHGRFEEELNILLLPRM